MKFLLSIQVGLREILAHKFRSFLTMFGIILGVASLIAMFATIEGTTRGMREHLMASGGVERFSVIVQDVPLGQEDLKLLSPGRTMEDVKAIRADCPLIMDVSPEVNLSEPAVQLQNKSIRPRQIVGGTSSLLNVDNFDIEEGRFISDLDQESYTHVCIIGWPIWDNLGQSRSVNPIGTTIKINDIPFQIIGVFRDYESAFERKLRESGKKEARQKRAEQRRSRVRTPKGGKSSRYAEFRNNLIVIPLSTMQATFKSASLDLGNGMRGPEIRLSALNVKAKDAEDLNLAVEQVRQVLLKVHRGVEDFGFETREDWAEDIESNVQATRRNGVIMSSISLLIGGIGIANIMLASITERVREIGIRMAVGARRIDIFSQILIESSVLGFLGGLIGLMAAFGLLELLNSVADLAYEPIVEGSSLVVSLGFSLLTGILAGIYPAIKASQLHPIQALRYE
jgi:putative ABC transport system permease protein